MDVREGPRRGGGRVGEALELKLSREERDASYLFLNFSGLDLRSDMSPTKKEPTTASGTGGWSFTIRNSMSSLGNLKNGILSSDCKQIYQPRPDVVRSLPLLDAEPENCSA